MRYQFLDEVIELRDESIVALRRIAEDEPCLRDHFPTFPILPGVIMLEVMVQAARRLLGETDPDGDRRVLGGVRALKYGAMVKPGMALRVRIQLLSRTDDGSVEFKGSGQAIPPGADPAAELADAPTAVSGRFTLRPLRVASAIPQGCHAE